MRPLRYVLQLPAYAAFAAFIGWFSASPAYHPIAPRLAVVKLSLAHAGELKVRCRTRTAEELARLAPNMRAAQDCPRERSDVRVELDMDGRALYRIEASPAGLRHDLPATIFRRVEIPAGRHYFRARLADSADAAFRYTGEATLDIPAGHVLVIDFVSSQGFVFRT